MEIEVVADVDHDYAVMLKRAESAAAHN